MNSRQIGIFAAVFTLLAFGVRAAETLPVSGTAFHVDASATSTLQTETVNGTNFVTRWNDASGGTCYATSAAGTRPWIDYEDGLPFVDFGPGRYGTSATTPTGFMKWSATDSSVREVFLVYSDYPGKSGSFILSAAGSYHFHRYGKGLFNPTYAHENLRNGLTEVDGVDISSTYSTYKLPEGFHIIHLRTTGNVTADRFASDRDQFQQGAQRLREVIVYNSKLSDENATKVYDYLYKKWWRSSSTFEIAGSTEGIASPTPGYGYYLDVAAGSNITCTAQAVWTNDAATIAAKCTGWKLYDSAGALKGSGPENTVTYVHPDPADYRRLEWQWEVEYKMTATAEAGGTVTNEVQWLKAGERFNTLAQADATHVFRKWVDGDGKEIDRAPDYKRRVAAPRALTAVFADALYVSTTGDDTNSGLSADKPLKTIAAALEKDSDAGIVLADGVYGISSTLTLTNGAILVGSSAGAKAVISANCQMSGDDPSVIVLKHADATVRNVAVTTRQNAYGRGVWLNGKGMVVDCVITNCRPIYIKNGGGVYLNGGGTVRRTRFDGDSTYSSGGNWTCGGAVYMSGGTVEDCTITRCGVYNNASSLAGGVWMTSGTLRNCLIARCSEGHTSTYPHMQASGVYISGGTMENCTVVANYQNSSTSVCGVRVVNSPTIRNCIVWGNKNANGVANWSLGSTTYNATCNCTPTVLTGTGNTTSDPAFVDMDGGDYHTLMGGGVDAALAYDWMAEGDDLDGRARVLGDAPDMGCYEYVPKAISCGFDLSAGTDLGRTDVTLTAHVKGDDLSGLVYTWTFTDSLGNVTNVVTNTTPVTVSMTTGIYDVRLSVTNAAGIGDSIVRAQAFSVKPKDIYVSETGKGIYPYDSYDNGTPDLQTALSAAGNGSVLYVDDGWYPYKTTLMLNKNIQVYSRNGPQKTKLHGTISAANMPMVSLGNSKAVLSGVTISGYDKAGNRPQYWGALEMSAGTVTNCWIVHQHTVNLSVNGAGGRLTGGTMVDCVISNNITQSSGGGGESGCLYITGGATVERCQIMKNTVTYGTGGSYGGGVYMTAGTVRNCLISGNYACMYGGGAALCGSSAKLINCTVVNNEAGMSIGGIWLSSGSVIDCLKYNNTANGIKEDMTDPGFVNAAEMDYHLTSASTAVDAGTGSDYGELDLDKMPRKSGNAVDQGCYEFDWSKFSIGITYAKPDGAKFAPMDITFTATIAPAGLVLDEAQSWWTLDGTEPSADNHAAVGTSFTTNLVAATYTVRFKTVYQGETYTVDKTDWFMLNGEKVYLVKSNPNAKPPYATWATAATSLDAALGYALADTTLVMSNGTYSMSKYHEISRKVTICSVNGPKVTIINGYGADHRFFLLKHSQGVISGITFCNGNIWDGGAVLMSAGLVTNCVFSSCYSRCGYTDDNGGAGVRMTGGKIVDCVFDSCYSDYNDKKGTALLLYGSGAVAERCIIKNSWVLNNQTRGAVYVGYGTLRNSLVVNNTCSKESGIVVGAGGIVDNCTVIANKSNNAGTYAAITCASGGQVRNTIVWDNKSLSTSGEGTYDHCLVDVDPKFRNPAKKDGKLRLESPAVEAGVKLDWMTEGSIDLYGNARISGLKPDIGCVEKLHRGMMLLMK